MKSALVTGASSGIGLAIADTLASNEYALTICARRPEPLRKAAEALREVGTEIAEVAADLGSEADIVRMVNDHAERYGSMDVLVNNAGITFGEGVGYNSSANIDAQINVNLKSVVLTCREAYPLLTKAAGDRGQALVINVASISGLRGQPYRSVYSATKHGVVGFTESINKELGSQGIKATVICPAVVDTNMTAFWRGRIDQSDMIRPEDVAGAVNWLVNTSPACVVPELALTLSGDEVRPQNLAPHKPTDPVGNAASAS